MSFNTIKVNNTQIVRVDDVPTSGSDNLVKSGGVYDALCNKKLQSQTVDYEVTQENGGIFNVYFDTVNIIAGHTYDVYIKSTTSNSGYLRIQSPTQYGQTFDNAENGVTIKDYQPSGSGMLIIYIREVSASGSMSVIVTERILFEDTINNILNSYDASDLVALSKKNRANPSDVRNGFYIDGSQGIKANSGRAVSGYIPIKSGETLACNNPSVGAGYRTQALFKHKGDPIPISGTSSTTPSGTQRTITNNLGYDCYAVFTLGASNHDNLQIELGAQSTQYVPYNELEESRSYTVYGEIGANYPEEMEVVKHVIDVDGNASINKLRFLHISDTHGGYSGYYPDFVRASKANFLVHTGDMVADKFSDDFESLKATFLAMSKPAFITLGNHDCYGSTSLADRYNKFISPLNAHNGLLTANTYYSVDYTTEKVKCIFMDCYDGIEDASAHMDVYTNFNISQSQLNWFISELQNALASNLAVVVFIHQAPGEIGSPKDEFYDWQNCNSLTNTILCELVQAFIEGRAYSCSYNGNTYNGSFNGKGMFAGWFSGHNHFDSCGTVKGYPSQFSICICRPYTNSDLYDGTFRAEKLGISYNYVSIDARNQKVGIMRIGNNRTYHGTDRKSFYYVF